MMLFLCLGIRQECLLSLPVLDLMLEILVNLVRQVREIKGVLIEKREIKMSLYSQDIVVYVENPKEPTNLLLEMISNYTKVSKYNFNIHMLFTVP